MDILLDKAMRIIANNKNLNEDEQEIVRYGLELFLIKTLLSFFALLIGIILHSVVEYLVYTVLFSMIRTSAGGYHSNTRIQCFIMSMLMFGIVFVLIKIAVQFSLVMHIIIILSMISFCIILITAPVDTANRPIGDEERIHFKNKTKVILLFDVFVSVIAYLFKYPQICCSVLLTLIIECILLILGGLSNKKKHI